MTTHNVDARPCMPEWYWSGGDEGCLDALNLTKLFTVDQWMLVYLVLHCTDQYCG